MLDYTRVTEVKYVSGGVDTETSDWHGPQSGALALERLWTGRTTFTLSTAEVQEDEEELKKDEETWEKIIGDLTKPVEMDTIYLVYPVRARRGGDIMLAAQEAVLRLKLWGLPVARLHSDRGSEFASHGAEEVMIRRKVFGKNKKYDLTANVVDPHVLLAEREPDDGRGVGKQPPPALMKLYRDMGLFKVKSGWTMKSRVQQQEEQARYFCGLGKFDVETCAEVLRDVHLGGGPQRKTRGKQAAALILGGYVHGSTRASTAITSKRPWLTKYLNMVLKTRTRETTLREPSWTTLGVFRAGKFHLIVISVISWACQTLSWKSGGLWLSDAHEANEHDGTKGNDLQRELPDGSLAEGRVVDIKDKVAVFDPKKLHSYIEGKDGEHRILAGFTPLGVEAIPPQSAAFMSRCGFPLENTGVDVYDVLDDEFEEANKDGSDLDTDGDSTEEEDVEQQARVLRCEIEEESKKLAVEDQESNYVRRLQEAFEKCAKELGRIQLKQLRQVLKICPEEAMGVEVEELLRALTGPLEVVQREPTRSAVTLLNPEQTRELKKAGLVVLPGKAVFTVKPPNDPDGPEKYRRKCRVVVCGNFLPAQGQNVYASGTSADTLRIAVALAVKMGWCIASTDVANAFTLAPMPKDLTYGLTPPTIVILAGAASPGETWQITRVLYGPREAARLWGDFRNARLAGARIEYEDVVIELTATTTDENLWRMTFSGDDIVQGLVLAYVDDFMICAARGGCRLEVHRARMGRRRIDNAAAQGLASEEALPLDGSVEFYAVVISVVVAAVGLWECCEEDFTFATLVVEFTN
ncbi:hypothetical protein AK812_SmicGene41130 [Symbiodinium microadriaticum]|uniref:Copia protein n=1 Tax=Symbiodinium microadriaticum TaxID=2951 RepID=A0A1Q9C6X6_SYMMI|nr:hypothetical protein AK812_SmicGene41130 [Symbiodinium microadriaticum]